MWALKPQREKQTDVLADSTQTEDFNKGHDVMQGLELGTGAKVF